MIFTRDEDEYSVYATFPTVHGEDVYECDFSICGNPVCDCSRVTIDFSPVSLSHEDEQSSTHKQD